MRWGTVEIFTGVLAVVGVLQLVVMFLTWRVYHRQAGIMEQQRATMESQWTTMQSQLTQMQSSGAQTNALIEQAKKQTKELHDATDIALAHAEAAVDSAKAAKISADIAAGVALPKLVVHEFKPGNRGAAGLAAMLQLPNVELILKNYGQTPALLISWSLLYTCEELPDIPDYTGRPGSGIVLTHQVIKPDTPYTLTVVDSWHRQGFSLDDVEAIIKHDKYLYAYGFVCYGDIFGNPFQRFKFCAMALNMGDGWIDWRTEFAPSAYIGTDRMPYENPQNRNDEAK